MSGTHTFHRLFAVPARPDTMKAYSAPLPTARGQRPEAEDGDPRRAYGDVFVEIPPSLGGMASVSGRHLNIAVNPSAVEGSDVAVPSFVSFPIQAIMNEGAGTGLVYDTAANSIALLRTLQADPILAGIVVTTDHANGVVNIGNALIGNNLTAGGGQGLYASKTGDLLNFKSLLAGANIVLTSTGTDVTINASGSISSFLVQNEGSGTGQVYDTTTSLPAVANLRTLQADPTVGNGGITVANAGTEINIGNTMTAVNVTAGGGQGLFASKTGPGILQFKSLIAGGGVVLTPTGTDITISLSGALANAFVQGGNAFGAAAVLGTTDNNSLSFIVRGVTAMSIANNTAITMTDTLTVRRFDHFRPGGWNHERRPHSVGPYIRLVHAVPVCHDYLLHGHLAGGPRGRQYRSDQ